MGEFIQRILRRHSNLQKSKYRLYEVGNTQIFNAQARTNTTSIYKLTRYIGNETFANEPQK